MSDAAVGRVEYVHHVCPARPVHLASIRAEVRRWLDPLGLTEGTQQNIVLAANEAASNAAEHAYLPATAEDTVELTFWVESPAICIEIVDHGRWRAPATLPGARGRGMMIMSNLIHTVLIHHDSRGTRVLLRHPALAPLDKQRAIRSNGRSA
jgi:serine/threonine-protein kinase RsbW